MSKKKKKTIFSSNVSLSYYLPIAGGRIFGFIPFPRVLVLCEYAISPGFELVSPCPMPATITITPRAPWFGFIAYEPL